MLQKKDIEYVQQLLQPSATFDICWQFGLFWELLAISVNFHQNSKIQLQAVLSFKLC